MRAVESVKNIFDWIHFFLLSLVLIHRARNQIKLKNILHNIKRMRAYCLHQAFTV